jgi:antitoxin component YwqK of YwqJK toxin-antitoxin module
MHMRKGMIENLEKEMGFLRIIIVVFLILMISCGVSKPLLIENSTEDGQVRYSVVISGKSKKQIFQGIYTAWYPNGAKKLEVTYDNGLKQGIETFWDAFGVKLRETFYNNGLREGKETYWDTKGKIKREVIYINDIQDGLEVTYNAAGQKVKDEQYVKGIKNGTETGYDEMGRVVYQSSYLNGKKDGKELFYDFSSGPTPTVTEIQWIQGEVAP